MMSFIEMLLGLLAIGQVVTGVVSWYFGMQVKMLRLELVNKETCALRHKELDKTVSKLFTELAGVQAALTAHREEHNA